MKSALLWFLLGFFPYVISVHILYYPVQVPAVGRLRLTDGIQFQVQNHADGTYHFGYDTGTQWDESYREETRDAQGRVQGRYGYVDPNGILRTVEYVADENGFRTRSADHVVLNNANIQVIGPIPKPVVMPMPVPMPMRKGYNNQLKQV